jgi:hypothetical protein
LGPSSEQVRLGVAVSSAPNVKTSLHICGATLRILIVPLIRFRLPREENENG